MERGQHSRGGEVGELCFLSHDDAEETFSGYGLVMADGRSDHLVGLLMVDRPEPVDLTWMAEIEEAYGEYSLIPMTETGERGIACQMRVEPDSLRLLRQLPHPLASEIGEALAPLLDAPPNPILKVRWDEERALWASQPWIGLSVELQQVFDRTGYGCFAAEREDMVAFITHAADEDIESFQGAQTLFWWELIEMPSAPLIRFQATILDDPRSPYALEHFVNIDDPEQTHVLIRLIEQEEIAFDFFGTDYEYAYSKHLSHPDDMREGLQRLMDRAIEYWHEIAPGEWDFDLAKAEYQRLFQM